MHTGSHSAFPKHLVKVPSSDFVGDLTPGRRATGFGTANKPKFRGGPLEFDEAKRQAEVWLAQLAGSAVRSIKTGTLREVLEAYWPTSGGSRFASERCRIGAVHHERGRATGRDVLGAEPLCMPVGARFRTVSNGEL